MQVANPSKILPPVFEAYVHSTAQVLSYDGLTGIPPIMMVDEAETNEAVIAGSKDQGKRIGSLKWIRSLMKDGNSKIPAHRDTNPSFKGRRDRFGGSNCPIQQQFPSSSSNPEWGPTSYGPPIQSKRQPRPSASSSPRQRSPSQGHFSAGNQKSSYKQRNGQPIQSTSSIPHQKPLPREPSLVGYGSGMYGPGLRGDSLKRLR